MSFIRWNVNILAEQRPRDGSKSLLSENVIQLCIHPCNCCLKLLFQLYLF